MKKIAAFLRYNFSYVFLLFSISVSAQDQAQWRVWVKTSPCSGRFDWIIVAKENPSMHGLSFYYLADLIESPLNCTSTPCTFDEATLVASKLSTSDQFSRYCCRDYSVWENWQTKEKSVVLGKHATAGYGWNIVKRNLCCEEAEVLAGIPGACSGASHDDPLQITCWPGSHAAWNPELHRTECYCNYGLVWNKTRTACIKSKKETNVDCSIYPGSYAAWNEQNQRMECFCPPGKTWNVQRTACVDDLREINCWPGSYAVVNARTGEAECLCKAGLVWNKTNTACITPRELAKQTDCSIYKGSVANWNEQSQSVECVCPTGKIWNSSKTACIDDPKTTTCWPGSHPAWNAQANRVDCYCDDGLVWNSTNTACIKPQEKKKAVTGHTWTLVSTTAVPDKKGGWTYSSGGSSAHMDLYNGDNADFSWTAPPGTIDLNGFSVTISASNKLGPNSKVMATLIGVSASGTDSDTPEKEMIAYAKIPDGSATASKTVAFKPQGSATEIEVEIGLMWGDVRIKYKYKRN